MPLLWLCDVNESANANARAKNALRADARKAFQLPNTRETNNDKVASFVRLVFKANGVYLVVLVYVCFVRVFV